MEVLVEVQDMFNDVAAGILEITSAEDNEMHRISSEHAANDMFAINSKATCFSEEVALHIKNPHAGARLSPSSPLFLPRSLGSPAHMPDQRSQRFCFTIAWTFVQKGKQPQPSRTWTN